jgi:hypothetical protein
LDQSAQEKAVTLPAGSIIDSDTGMISAAGTPILVANTVIAQPGGPMLRVLLAQVWTINGVKIRGSLPVAFVASDRIDVQGVIDASADGDTGGPGAQACGSGSGGGGKAQAFFEQRPPDSSPGYPAFLFASNGGGGGGFGTAGGSGGFRLASLQVGTAGQPNGNAELVPLRGGCEGGGDIPQHRGAGGGAVQLVSGKAVHLAAGAGVIHAGGGRSIAGALGRISDTDTTPVWGPGGGGSGGGILLEAPSFLLDDGTALLAGGGGAGGYGACNPAPDGLDAAASAAPATGGICPAGTSPSSSGGDGATIGTGASGQNAAGGSAGGGAGGLGRIRINTTDGHYSVGMNCLIRGVVTTGVLGRR